MAWRAQTVHDRLERASLTTGMTIIIWSAVVVTVLSFVPLPFWLAILVVLAAGSGLGTGAYLHISTRKRQRDRNRRHRDWLDTLPPGELPAFRSDLAAREETMEVHLRAWLRPLVATAFTILSAVFVPYELIGSHSPHVLVEPINTVWVLGTITLAICCLVTAVFAAARKDPTENAAEDELATRRRDAPETTASGRSADAGQPGQLAA